MLQELVQAQTCGLNRQNGLQILNQNGQLLVDSRDVAIMVEKEHKNLLRDIKGYVNTLDGSNLSSQDFFIESTYTNLQNKEQPCYLLTKKGCDMVANKLTGEKGVIFTAQYVTAFEEMKEKLSNPIPKLSKELQAIFVIDERTVELEGRVDHLEDTMVVDYSEQEFLNKHARARVLIAVGGKESNAYKKLSKVIFKELWGDYKTYFQINSYKNTPRVRYLEALEYIKNWEPCSNNKLQILHLNSL